MPQPSITARSSLATLGLVLAMATAPPADASPRFKATNKTDQKINVYIFSGNDSFCTVEEKLKRLSAGETDAYGCTGGGKGQCKVQFYVAGRQICSDDTNTCSRNATKMAGNSAVVITSTTILHPNGQEVEMYDCSFSD